MRMDVAFCPEAEEGLPVAERAAMLSAIEKLEAIGLRLPYPHSSAVKGGKLRDLRPRGGRGPWRAFYRRLGDQLVVGSIGPEANTNPSGFRRALAAAERRLAAIEREV